MSSIKMNTETYNNLFKLFQEYYCRENVTGDEFIEIKLVSPDSPSLTENEIEKFVLIVTHKDFLSAVKNNFVSQYNLRNYNEVRIMMVIFVLLFGLDEMNAEEIFQVFRNIKCAFKSKLLQFFCVEDNLIQTALIGCKHFEDAYILDRIINPLLNKTEILKKVEEYLYKEKIQKRVAKLPTVPVHVNVLQRKKSVPVVPLNTPVEAVTFQAKDIPRSLYQRDNTETKLVEKFEKNRLKAEKLLAQAKNLNKNYCKLKQPLVPEEVLPPQFKAKKAPRIKKHVETKGNVATVLREASLCIKEEENEIKNVEAIIQGGGTLDKYRELEENVRKLEQEKSLEDIERKHLAGLLTFEEAILAKRKLIESNKERFKEFMEERINFLNLIKEWREREQEKMRILVKKGQEIERSAKEAEKKLKKEKKNQVDQFKDETKKMLQEMYDKQKEELAKKVRLIEEIKTLHQLKSLHPVKEFDPNECPNLGLLCQMSIADLQQKLSELKFKMERQLEEKRRCIRKHKERQREMIENVKNFITQTRMSKPKRASVPIRPAELPHSPDLDKLRDKLEYAREQRKHHLKLENIPCSTTLM